MDTATYHFDRTLPLSPDKLFHIMTDPKHRESWSGPDADTVLVAHTTDLRVGGQDRFYSGAVDAPDFEIETRWYDLTGSERAVFTETLIIGGTALCTSLVTYALTPHGDTTKLAVTVAVSSFSGPDTAAEFQAGWTGGLDNLGRYIAAQGA